MSKINLDKLPIYVINLEKSTGRWNKVEQSFKKEKMDKNLIKFLACDGSILDVEKMRKNGDVKIPVKDRANRPGAIANYLSIMGVFKDALKKKHKHIILMEDDQILAKDFKKKLEVCIDQVNKVNKKWDILYLASDEAQKRTQKIDGVDKVRIPFQDKKSQKIYGNNGFLITDKCMRSLLKHSMPMVEASDHYIIGMGKNPFHKNKAYPGNKHDYYNCYPYLIKSFEANSTID
jgi:GR25 family glycosyltransferase involved in LPS biosynthesis